ncbi:MAG: pentapeptide repeat-containing protein [Pirellulales bacterium]
MVEPIRAVVRPRVYARNAGFAASLEDEIQVRLEAGQRGFVELVGPAGAGKSTALNHLAYVFAGCRELGLFDQPVAADFDELSQASRNQLIVLASPAGALPIIVDRLPLAAWNEDEWIEFLLAEHRAQCASVIGRLRQLPPKNRLIGTAVYCRAVLEMLAADESLYDPDAAVRALLVRRLAAEYDDVAKLAFAHSTASPDSPPESKDRLLKFAVWRGIEHPLTLKLLQDARVGVLLAADHVARVLRGTGEPVVLDRPLSRKTLEAAAKLLQDSDCVKMRLHEIVERCDAARQPAAVSLLHALDSNWKPRDGVGLYLTDAILPDVSWSGIRQQLIVADRADLSGGNFRETRLDRLLISNADLSNSVWTGASVVALEASGASFRDADLSTLRSAGAVFCQADLRGAQATAAMLRRSDFEGADLRHARFQRADLTCTWLQRAQIDDADFAGADLSGADLKGVDLRNANFAGATFYRAYLNGGNLESLLLPGANFREAELCATNFTDTEMPHAVFYGADLRGAYLAGIEWEHADLRDANLRFATFHLGSSRSGLVDSPIASEGSRTGFYTDDYDEQGFKVPEEIRKANLRGADLRGAKIDDVDFYLVDLRDAKYTERQEEHFRRCRAILESRV